MKAQPNQNDIDNLGEYIVAWIDKKINQKNNIHVHWYPDSKAKKIIKFLAAGLGVEDFEFITKGAQ